MRPFLMAQVVCALFKIAGNDSSMRLKITGVLTEMVDSGEVFDWTKAANNGFSLPPKGSSSTMAVDHFTGEEMNSIKRRLRSYNMTPASYQKIFGLSSVRVTSVRYSNSQKTKTKNNRPIPGARKVAANPYVNEFKNIKDTLDSLSLKGSASILSRVSDAQTRKSTRGLKQLVNSIIEDLYDLPVPSKDRDKVAKIITNLGSIVERLSSKNSESASSTGHSTGYYGLSVASILHRLSVLLR